MTSPAIRLARECGVPVNTLYGSYENRRLERFYALAQAQALRDAAERFEGTDPDTAYRLRRMAEELERGA